MIIGAHYDAGHASPVTSANPSENRLRTKADNELLMDDKIDHQIIKLRTYKGFNILQFDAKKAEHMLRLASEQGAMVSPGIPRHLYILYIACYAKQTYHHKSGDTHEERSGNDRIQVVENKSVTTTKNKGIHHQTPTDILQNAGTNIIHEATGNIEITAKQNQIIVVEDENMEITVEGPGGMRVHIKNDELTIQSAKDINIQGNGGGDITLHQGGGGICVTADGNIKLFGNKVQLEGHNGVRFNGTVNYTIGSGAKPAPSVAALLKTTVFDLLFGDLIEARNIASSFCIPCALARLAKVGEPTIYNLRWSQSRVPVGEPVNAIFNIKNFSQVETATINVYEWDPDDSKELITTLTIDLEPDVKEYAIEFIRDEEETRGDLIADQQANDKSPLEYRFEVLSDSFQLETDSTILNLISDITFEIYDDGNAF